MGLGARRGVRASSRATRNGASSAGRAQASREDVGKTQGGLMVLVDTSVWIRFLANRALYASELDRLLGANEVAGHGLVYGELLVGDPGGRGKLLAAYEQMHQAKIVPHRDVVTFVRDRKLHGRGVGWIDVHLLASALVNRIPLWTADQRFATLARELGVAYEAPAS